LVNRIQALAEALEDTDISEVDLAEHGTRIVIRRRLAPPLVLPRSPASNGAHPARYLRRPRAMPMPADEVPAPDPTVAIVAPLTGVFYAAASPTVPPYVQAGETIQAGQVVCIVEAMKVFNEIKSEISGTVAAVLAQSGQLVRKGDALIRVQPV
jgi:acetyl-CoA carboxylase biotin carboxyl carrier protein